VGATTDAGVGGGKEGNAVRPPAGPALLVRRGYVCDWEAGDRPLPPPDRVLRWGRRALLPLSTVACVATRQRVVALTYDDGPDPENTPGVLDALAAEGATATFFVLADRAEEHPELLRRIAAEGHDVGLHGEDHTRLSTLPAREALTRIRRGRRRLEAVLGRPVTLYRPAYGAQSLVQAAGTRAAGLEVVLWTAWARDWEASTAEDVARRALGAVHPGAFLLLHDATGDLGTAGGPALRGSVGGRPAQRGSAGGGPAPFDRGAVSRLLLGGLRDAGYATATVSSLLATYPGVRTIWSE
jgi:peptidoglycan/xylan/chitin deacetylase (PgdA/CDA1 family)